METVTIPKSEYNKLQQSMQLFNMLKNDNSFFEKLQAVYNFIQQINKPEKEETQKTTKIIPAKNNGNYTDLFGSWSDMTISTEDYRK